jgi:hypothetical protein
MEIRKFVASISGILGIVLMTGIGLPDVSTVRMLIVIGVLSGVSATAALRWDVEFVVWFRDHITSSSSSRR